MDNVKICSSVGFAAIYRNGNASVTIKLVGGVSEDGHASAKVRQKEDGSACQAGGEPSKTMCFQGLNITELIVISCGETASFSAAKDA